MAAPPPSFYFEKLYPLQDEVLAVVSRLDTGLYLTGGTAASRAYLRHRFSDDLDLFADDDHRFGLWAERVIEALARHGGWRVEVQLREERFARLDVGAGDVALKIEMVNDVPARVGEVRTDTVLGRLDTAENILANKVSALVDRQEPKDLADVWGFCCLMRLPLADALRGAQGKAVGSRPTWRDSWLAPRAATGSSSAGSTRLTSIATSGICKRSVRGSSSRSVKAARGARPGLARPRPTGTHRVPGCGARGAHAPTAPSPAGRRGARPPSGRRRCDRQTRKVALDPGELFDVRGDDRGTDPPRGHRDQQVVHDAESVPEPASGPEDDPGTVEEIGCWGDHTLGGKGALDPIDGTTA